LLVRYARASDIIEQIEMSDRLFNHRYDVSKHLSIALLLGLATPTLAEPVTSVDDFFQPDGMTATAENYPTLETSRQLLAAQDRAAVNNFAHNRKLTPTDDQPVVRMNRDTFYSFAVVDVSAGASITIPPVPEGKYVSVQPVTMDHRIQPMSYGSGTFELATHYGSHMYLIVRLDSTLSEAEANAIQDDMVINAASAQPFSAEPVNRESFDAAELSLRQQLPALVAAHGTKVVYGMFTAPTDDSRGLYDFEKYTVGAALGWGGAQLRDNLYETSPSFPAEGCYSATFEDPDNGAFWSFTVYDENGFMFDDVAHMSSDIAAANEDGTYTVSMGCGADAVNNLPISNETGIFNFTVRHYIPSDRVKLDEYRLAPLMQKVD
jgi:hypothetical protein